MKFFKLLGIVWVAAVWASCAKGPGEEPAPGPGASDEMVNRWIYSVMKEQYLYNGHVDTLAPNFSQGSEIFFSSLLSASPEDNDGKHTADKNYFYSYMERLDGTKSLSGRIETYGMEYVGYYADRTYENYIARVLYVVPDSPADRAGIRRGDWISQIDGKNISYNLLQKLKAGEAASFLVLRFAIRDGETQITEQKTVRIDAAQQIDVPPALFSTVIDKGPYKIGYLVYNSFDTGPEGPTVHDFQYDEQLKTIFADFKQQGVNELVLDLRYNGGGYISSCQLLCSLIVGEQYLGQNFCMYRYNPKMAAQKGEPVTKFLSRGEVSGSNLNLSRLYVLTGSWTASASELVINGLRPYMTVKIVGTQTEGKNVGSYEIRSDSYQIALHPITLQLFNKDRQSDYRQGFAPDWWADDFGNQDQMLELGDEDEFVLSRAIFDITGRTQPVSKAGPTHYPFLPDTDSRPRLSRVRGAILAGPQTTVTTE